MESFTDDLNSPLPKQMQSEMMDDVRPSSLPTNDCAASDARRIEGRPDTALQRGTLAIASKVVSSEDPFRNLSDHILEHILARLSLFPLVAAKKVCKRWASVTSTPEFDILRKELNPKPRLVRCGISRLGSSKSGCFAYDVENNAWLTLPALQLPAHNYGSAAGASGVVFAIAGPGEDRLLYKLTSSASSAESFGETWYETPVMTFPRWEPVVSVAVGAGMGHKVVVAGGGSDVRNYAGFRAVEVFDSESGTWESYGDLPEEFDAYNSRTWMSGVVCDNKFYVLYLDQFENDKVQIHFLDFYTKQWASIQLERPEDLVHSRIMAIGTTLMVAGLCEGKTEDHVTVKLWKVDLKTLSWIQIGLMPSELVALLGEPINRWRLPLTFLVDENLVYVCIYEHLVLAEVCLEECQTCWRLLPEVLGVDLSVNSYITFLASISSA